METRGLATLRFMVGLMVSEPGRLIELSRRIWPKLVSKDLLERFHGLIGSVGEIAAINNCTTILTDMDGQYQLSAAEALKAYADLSLYTTAEACPMVYFSFLASPNQN